MLEINKRLLRLYIQWAQELKGNCSELLNDNYSNPYYVSIPNGWETAKNRIMVIGKEGYSTGAWGKWKGLSVDSIDELQEYNYEVMMSNIDRHQCNEYEKRKGAFWGRMRRIYQEFDCSCIWNNLDKIHHKTCENVKKNNSPLTCKEQKILHSTPTKILKNEIEILKPTMVVFFGWYTYSLSSELPYVAELLVESGWDKANWQQDIPVIEVGNIKYIFTYHPNRKPKAYEQLVIDTIRENIK